MIDLEPVGQTLRLLSIRDGTDAYPKAHPPGTLVPPDVDGEAGCAELADQPHRAAFLAESSHLDRKAVLRRRFGERRRRRGSEVGVAFLDVAPTPPPAEHQAVPRPAGNGAAAPPAEIGAGPADTGLANRVARLEAEFADLKKLLVQVAANLQKGK